MRVSDILASTPVKGIDKSTLSTPSMSPSTRLGRQGTPAQEIPSFPILVTPPASPLRKKRSGVPITPNHSPRRQIGTSNYSPVTPQKRARIQRDGDDRWIRYVNDTRGPEDTTPEDLGLPGTDNTSPEDTLRAPRTARAILMEGLSTRQPSLKRKRIESDEDEEHVHKRIRLETTEPLLDGFDTGLSLIRTRDIEDTIQSDIKPGGNSGYGWASSLPCDKENDIPGENSTLACDDSQLIADMECPTESAKALYDESCWALDLYHSQFARGERPELIKQAQSRLVEAQGRWNQRAEVLVREGQYDLLEEILRRDDETFDVSSFTEDPFATF
ncbi:hypothetical protein FRC17_010425 [Serendipita sp. 399]|nr:hypothetical protein FRC17_010425 [Serendipita sp. 399]